MAKLDDMMATVLKAHLIETNQTTHWIYVSINVEETIPLC